jgi:hypothetical protein
VQLRARSGRAVLADDRPEVEPREVDPHSLAIGGELADALHEWARVADAVANAEGELAVDGAATSLISRRGRQLAARVAAVMGAPVGYLDPLTGEVSEVSVPEPDFPPQADAVAGTAAVPYVAEPTPWATGLTVTVITAIVVTLAVIVLSLAIGGDSRWLALGANVVIAIGLSPSVWLARRVPVWRWVSYGVVAGVGVAWLALLFTLL